MTTNSTESVFPDGIFGYISLNLIGKTHFESKETRSSFINNFTFELFMIFYSFEMCTFFQLVKNSAALTNLIWKYCF